MRMTCKEGLRPVFDGLWEGELPNESSHPCRGLGTRISEESHLRPKPMIEIGGSPILWHIMKYYFSYGFDEFIICCGYKGYVIKEYFADYYLHHSDITFDFSNGNEQVIHSNEAEPWKVTVVDTGLETMTGGRIKRIKKYVEGETFMLTYGDGVSTVNLNALLDFHRKNGRLATITAIQPGGRFGVIDMDKGGIVHRFAEKAREDGGWINGGFMVLDPEIFDYISEDEACVLERQPMEALASEGMLGIYRHTGFWQCMDTRRDKARLELLWKSPSPPWKLW